MFVFTPNYFHLEVYYIKGLSISRLAPDWHQSSRWIIKYTKKDHSVSQAIIVMVWMLTDRRLQFSETWDRRMSGWDSLQNYSTTPDSPVHESAVIETGTVQWAGCWEGPCQCWVLGRPLFAKAITWRWLSGIINTPSNCTEYLNE